MFYLDCYVIAECKVCFKKNRETIQELPSGGDNSHYRGIDAYNTRGACPNQDDYVSAWDSQGHLVGVNSDLELGSAKSFNYLCLICLSRMFCFGMYACIPCKVLVCLLD